MPSLLSQPRARVPSARQRVYDAMCEVSYDRNLAPSPTTHRGKLALIEGVAHELAHQLEAGRNFEWRLDEKNMEQNEANEHEAATLRIEVAALAELGVRVSLRNLWRDAGWRGERPPLADVARALSDRERRCVAAFVRIVRKAMEAATC